GGVARAFAREVVLVVVEALVEAEAPVEHERRHDRGGLRAGGAHACGQRVRTGSEALPVLDDAVRDRRGAREERYVARQRRRGGRIRGCEAHAFGRELRELRRGLSGGGTPRGEVRSEA